MRIAPPCLFLILASASLLPAQDAWTELKPPLDPGPRYQHAMAFDSARNRIVLFGGRTKQAVLNDTWEFDGLHWTQMNPANPPPGISLDPKMAYDSRRKTMVMIRLESATNPMVVWEYDGVDWKSLTPAIAPAGDPFSLAFDEERGLTVLFKDGSNPSSAPETWEWDGTIWRQRSPTRHPPGVIQNAMAFDPVRRKVILYGGYSSGGGATASTRTHEWDGVQGEWNELASGSPPSRSDHAMACDPAHGRVILFGGYYPFSPKAYRPGTWQWHRGSWTRLVTAAEPPLRHSYGAALDALGRVIVFGGVQDGTILGDTWAFASAPPAAVGLFGSGCRGTHMLVPALDPKAPPILGNAFACDVRNAPPGAAGVFFLGLSNPALDLTGLAAPGCFLLASLELWSIVAANPAGTLLAPVALGVPLDPALLRGVFYFQFFFLDPQANPLGVISTDGGKGTLGY